MDNSSGNIDQQLLKAYQETIYQVLYPPIAIQIGIPNPALDAFLIQHNSINWAFVTAWNPRSKQLSIQENNQRHEELIKLIKKVGYSCFFGKGIGKDASWTPEVSLLVLNIEIKAAIAIGQYFDQNAIVVGESGGLPTLIIL